MPMPTMREITRGTSRRISSTARTLRAAPGAVARTAVTTTVADAARWTRDMVVPYEHELAPPPVGTDLKPVMGHGGWPLVGGIPGLTGDRPSWTLQRHREYGPLFWTQMAGDRFVIVAGPDAVKQVLVNPGKDFSNEGWQRLIGPFFDRGLMLLSFGEHLDHRRIMQSAFHPTRLDGYLSGMDRRITQSLEEEWPTAGEMTMYRRTKELAMQVAAEVFLGMEFSAAERKKILAGFHAQPRAATENFRLDVPFTLWAKGRNGYDHVTDIFRREIPRKRAQGGDDLFSAMVHAEDEDGATFTDEEIVRHMNFMWFAAHDTTTLAMTMMAYGFAIRPDWQDRAHAESAALGDGPLRAEDLSKLAAIDLVMKEVMRLWPPVPAMMRQAVRDVDLDGYHVPAGTYVAVMNPATHRLEEFWKDPHTFDPARFEAPREEHKAHSHVYIPFGAGVHKCIGFAFAEMETKALWHRLLLTRRFSVAPGYEPDMGWKALPEPNDDLPVIVSAR